jgi:hypothetical protein
VLDCPKCAGQRRVLAAIHDPAAIERVLRALGLAAAVSAKAACRPLMAEEGPAANEGRAASWVLGDAAAARRSRRGNGVFVRRDCGGMGPGIRACGRLRRA